MREPSASAGGTASAAASAAASTVALAITRPGPTSRADEVTEQASIRNDDAVHSVNDDASPSWIPRRIFLLLRSLSGIKSKKREYNYLIRVHNLRIEEQQTLGKHYMHCDRDDYVCCLCVMTELNGLQALSFDGKLLSLSDLVPSGAPIRAQVPRGGSCPIPKRHLSSTGHKHYHRFHALGEGQKLHTNTRITSTTSLSNDEDRGDPIHTVSYVSSDPRQGILEQLLIDLVVENGMTSKIIESKSLRNLLAITSPRFRLPSALHIAECIKSREHEASKEIKRILDSVDAVSISLTARKGTNGDVLDVAAHGLSQTIEPFRFLLGRIPTTEGDLRDAARAVVDVCIQWGIRRKIVAVIPDGSQSAAWMTKALTGSTSPSDLSLQNKSANSVNMPERPRKLLCALAGKSVSPSVCFARVLNKAGEYGFAQLGNSKANDLPIILQKINALRKLLVHSPDAYSTWKSCFPHESAVSLPPRAFPSLFQSCVEQMLYVKENWSIMERFSARYKLGSQFHLLEDTRQALERLLALMKPLSKAIDGIRSQKVWNVAQAVRSTVQLCCDLMTSVEEIDVSLKRLQEQLEQVQSTRNVSGTQNMVELQRDKVREGKMLRMLISIFIYLSQYVVCLLPDTSRAKLVDVTTKVGGRNVYSIKQSFAAENGLEIREDISTETADFLKTALMCDPRFATNCFLWDDIKKVEFYRALLLCPDNRNIIDSGRDPESLQNDAIEAVVQLLSEAFFEENDEEQSNRDGSTRRLLLPSQRRMNKRRRILGRPLAERLKEQYDSFYCRALEGAVSIGERLEREGAYRELPMAARNEAVDKSAHKEVEEKTQLKEFWDREEHCPQLKLLSTALAAVPGNTVDVVSLACLHSTAVHSEIWTTLSSEHRPWSLTFPALANQWVKESQLKQDNRVGGGFHVTVIKQSRLWDDIRENVDPSTPVGFGLSTGDDKFRVVDEEAAEQFCEDEWRMFTAAYPE